MKKLKMAAIVVRFAGIALLLFALILSFVVNSTTKTAWKDINDLTGNDFKFGFFDRFRFDRAYQAALLKAQSFDKKDDINTRLTALKPYFGFVAEPMAENDRKALESRVEETKRKYADGTFDAEAYVAYYEDTESRRDEARLVKAYEYLDTLVAVKKGKGKAGLSNNKSVRGEFETYYNTLCETHGDEVGSFADFSETVAQMAKDYVAENGMIAASEYLTAKFDFDKYMEYLPAILDQMENAEDKNLLDDFAEPAYLQAAGLPYDYEAVFESTYREMAESTGTAAEYEYYVLALDAKLGQKSFDGSFESAKKATEEQKNAVQSAGFERKFNSYLSVVVANCEKTGAFWLVCGRWSYAFLIAGIMLIIAAGLMSKKALEMRIKSVGVEHKDIADDVLVRVENLCQYFGPNKAVDDVSFDVKKGEVFGLVGESGCGKTTTGRSIIKLYDITSGNIYYKGMRIAAGTGKLEQELRALKRKLKDLKAAGKAHPDKALEAELTNEIKRIKQSIANAKFDHKYCDKVHASEIIEAVEEKFKPLLSEASGEQLKQVKKQYAREMMIARKQHIVTKIQMIFQDPIASLDPRMTVREIIAEGLRIQGETDEKVIDEKVYSILETVGLVREHAGRYPHEFSGGQKQRIGVARAVVMNPEMIIADEPVSALDVSIQAQVINLLDKLRHEMGLTVMFIAHDLSVVKYFSDRIGVMYYGHMVELATSDELFAHPLHPYTRSLLSAIPLPDPEYEKHRIRIKYDPMEAHDYSVQQPTLREIRPGHFVSCNDEEFEKYNAELEGA